MTLPDREAHRIPGHTPRSARLPLAGYEEQLAHTKLAAADGMGPY